MSLIGYSDGGSTRAISDTHCSHAYAAPEVVHPQEAALEQVLAQRLDFVAR